MKYCHFTSYLIYFFQIWQARLDSLNPQVWPPGCSLPLPGVSKTTTGPKPWTTNVSTQPPFKEEKKWMSVTQSRKNELTQNECSYSFHDVITSCLNILVSDFNQNCRQT